MIPKKRDRKKRSRQLLRSLHLRGTRRRAEPYIICRDRIARIEGIMLGLGEQEAAMQGQGRVR